MTNQTGEELKDLSEIVSEVESYSKEISLKLEELISIVRLLGYRVTTRKLGKIIIKVTDNDSIQMRFLIYHHPKRYMELSLNAVEIDSARARVIKLTKEEDNEIIKTIDGIIQQF